MIFFYIKLILVLLVKKRSKPNHLRYNQIFFCRPLKISSQRRKKPTNEAKVQTNEPPLQLSHHSSPLPSDHCSRRWPALLVVPGIRTHVHVITSSSGRAEILFIQNTCIYVRHFVAFAGIWILSVCASETFKQNRFLPFSVQFKRKKVGTKSRQRALSGL